jgi:hypothetical protein
MNAVGLEVGSQMPDGTIYVGISPDTGRPLFAMSHDAPLPMKWAQAMDYAAGLDAHGYTDWRLPTRWELLLLFNNRTRIRGLNGSGPVSAAPYWSSTENPAFDDAAWSQRFCDGHHGHGSLKKVDAALRLVRS